MKSIIVNNEPHLDQYKPVFPREMFELKELLLFIINYEIIILFKVGIWNDK